MKNKKRIIISSIVLILLITIILGMILWYKNKQNRISKEELVNTFELNKVYTFTKKINDNEYMFEYVNNKNQTINFKFTLLDGFSELPILNYYYITSNIIKENNSLTFSYEGEFDFNINVYKNIAEIEIESSNETKELYDFSQISGIYELTNLEQTNEIQKPNLPALRQDQYTVGFEMDEVLAKSIREELEMSETELLTKEILNNIDSLYISENKLITLKGIEYLTNLERILIGDNYLTDITELTKLKKIVQISIGSGYIKEIPDFRECEYLTELNITSNLISDLSPVNLIPNLKYLILSNNDISSIAELKDNTKLELLDLENNPIIDYSLIKDNKKLQSALTLKYSLYLSVENKGKEIVSNLINDSMSEVEKEFIISQYIINKMHYDESPRPQRPYAYYGIIEDYGVCGDYAETMTYLGKLAGLDISVVSSITHEWNIIKIDNSYYNIDVLWQDDGAKLDYFNRSTDYVFSLDYHDYDLNRYPLCENDMNPLLFIHLFTDEHIKR